MNTSSSILVLLVGIAVYMGCDDATPFDVNQGNPVSIALMVDSTQFNSAGPNTEYTISVKLVGADRAPVEGWPVAWIPSSASALADAPQGMVSSDTTNTDAAGVASVVWTLGSVPETYYLEVRAAGVARSSVGGTEPLLPAPGRI